MRFLTPHAGAGLTSFSPSLLTANSCVTLRAMPSVGDSNAQPRLRSMEVNNEEYDFTEPARRLLETSNVFGPARFSSAWKIEIKRAINEAVVNNPANFRRLVQNGVKGVEIVLGWFDSTTSPRLIRHHIAIEISQDGKLILNDSGFEVQPGCRVARFSAIGCRSC